MVGAESDIHWQMDQQFWVVTKNGECSYTKYNANNSVLSSINGYKGHCKRHCRAGQTSKQAGVKAPAL